MTVHESTDFLLVTDPDAKTLWRSSEASDVYRSVLQSATHEVSTDAQGKARLSFVRPFSHAVFSVTVTRATSGSTKGFVTVVTTGADGSGVSLLFHDAAGALETNQSRRVSYTAVGADVTG